MHSESSQRSSRLAIWGVVAVFALMGAVSLTYIAVTGVDPTAMDPNTLDPTKLFAQEEEAIISKSSVRRSAREVTPSFEEESPAAVAASAAVNKPEVAQAAAAARKVEDPVGAAQDSAMAVTSNSPQDTPEVPQAVETVSPSVCADELQKCSAWASWCASQGHEA